MSVNISILGTEKLVAKFERATPVFLQRMKEGMTSGMSLLSSYIKREKLSGQVLKNRTGTLRRSISAKIRVEGYDTVVGSVGTNVVYGKTHELGLTIPAHDVVARRFKALRFFWEKGRFGDIIIVKKVRIPPVKMPMRPFLSSGFKDKKAEIFAKLQVAGRLAAHDLKA